MAKIRAFFVTLACTCMPVAQAVCDAAALLTCTSQVSRTTEACKQIKETSACYKGDCCNEQVLASWRKASEAGKCGEIKCGGGATSGSTLTKPAKPTGKLDEPKPTGKLDKPSGSTPAAKPTLPTGKLDKPMGKLTLEEVRAKFGAGKRSKGLTQNKKGMDKMKEMMKMKKPPKGFPKGGFLEMMEKRKNASKKCKHGDLTCLKEIASKDKDMTKFTKAEFVRESLRKQKSEKMRGFEKSKKSGKELLAEMCPECVSITGTKKHHCFAKCKKEAANDLVQEDIEKCMSEKENIADCMCSMNNGTSNVTGKMNVTNVMRTMQIALKGAVCGMFKKCKDSGGKNNVTTCKEAAEQVIDDAACIKEKKQHFLRGCMMQDLKALQNCDASEARDCFKSSLKSLEQNGFKKRQGKQLLAAQALQSAYEAFDDCNCSNTSANIADCHENAKDAYKGMKKIGKEDAKFNSYYEKLKPKIEKLAKVVCAGGETTTKLKEAMSIEFADGKQSCSNSNDVTALTAKVANLGFGALDGTANCMVDFGSAFIKTKYFAAGKTSEQISAGADQIVSHFTKSSTSKGTTRRLATSYDEVYADQDSEEVGVEEDETTPPTPPSTVSSGAHDDEGAIVPIGMAILIWNIWK